MGEWLSVGFNHLCKTMKHLAAKFRELSKAHQDWGALSILRLACIETKPSKQMIRYLFRKYVPKDDYDREDKKEILNDLFGVS